MKSFFVIKGNPHQWFDQQGNAMALIDAGKTGEPYIVPHVKSTAEDAQGAETFIDDPNTVSYIKLAYYVQVCKTEDEVNFYAKEQNRI